MSHPLPRHTHERVDQFFSRLSIRISSGDIKTIEDLERAVKECYTPSPDVFWLKGVLNIQEWLEPCLPHARQVEGITQHQFYYITRDPHADGPVKSVIHSRCYSNTPLAPAPCHLLLNLPKDKPCYGPCRRIFHGKADTPEGADVHFLKMKQEIYNLARRAGWSDDILIKWASDFDWLDKLQRREASEFEGFWPEDYRDTCRINLGGKIRDFYGIISTTSESLVPDVDGEIAQASQESKFKLLAELREQLKVRIWRGWALVARTCEVDSGFLLSPTAASCEAETQAFFSKSSSFDFHAGCRQKLSSTQRVSQRA